MHVIVPCFKIVIPQLMELMEGLLESADSRLVC